MIREKAIYEFEDILGELSNTIEVTENLRAACKMAIKALEQEPCDDCISRQAVLDIIEDVCPIYGNDYRYILRERVNDLSPVNPAEKVGHWVVTDDDLVYCSECEDSYYAKPIDASWYYCPHCGAKMQEVEE